jgi:hypothetical protein
MYVNQTGLFTAAAYEYYIPQSFSLNHLWSSWSRFLVRQPILREKRPGLL